MLDSFPKLPSMVGGSSYFHQGNDQFEPDPYGDNLMYLNSYEYSPELENLASRNPFDSIVGKYTHNLGSP